MIKFLILSAINSGLLQSDNVEPYTDQANSRLEVSPLSPILKTELKFSSIVSFLQLLLLISDSKCFNIRNFISALSDTRWPYSLDFAPTLRFLQYNEDMLQKVEQEERLAMAHGSHVPSTPPDANIQCSNENNLFDEDQVHHEALLQELIPFLSNVQNGCDMSQSNKVEPWSNTASASPNETALPVAAQKPDFSLVRGEICLDNLPIKALQETFRATFGRETTVKDKTWLKRRISMGLINSCDVPTTNLRIKDNKLVGNPEKSNDVTDVVSDDMGDHVRATNPKDAPSSTDHVNGHSNASGHSLSGNHYCASEDFSHEQSAAKRVRKPTRRYIEELSETDEKQQIDKPMIPSKDQRLSEKSEVRSISVSSGKRVAVTRIVSLAGSEIEVPYVSHVRRSRPRENIMALMVFLLVTHSPYSN